MIKKSCLIIIFLSLLFCLSKNSYTGTIFQQVGITSSPNPVGSGARAMGMGGAFIAIADDATAASWNPAGLIQLEKPELSFAGCYFNKKEEFYSKRHPESNNSDKADDININYFSATYAFELKSRNMVLSLNYQRLYEFKRRFDYRYDYSSLGENLYQNNHFEQNGYLSALGLAYAIEVTPRLSLGATLNIWTDKLFWKNSWQESYYVFSTGTQGGVPVTVATQYTDKYSNFHGINFNFGLLWNMKKNLMLGLVLKTPFDASIYHESHFTQQSIYGPPISKNASNRPEDFVENVELRMPLSFGIGLAWRISDSLSFDLDIYRTIWTDYILTDSKGYKFSPIDGRPESASAIDNTIQVRFGAEYLFINQKRNFVVPVRGGIFYDPEPSHNEVKRFYGISVGSGIAHKKIIFDLAYQLRLSRQMDTGNLIVTSKADITQHHFLTSMIVHF